MKKLHALRNSWYQAAWSNEVTQDSPLTRTILNETIFLFRQSNGDISALHDRCPHRFAPLSAGRIEGNNVYCGYHGLGFNGEGECIKNPHGGISSRLTVKSYPVEERHTAIWIWMGDTEKANADDIPNLSFIDAVPEETRVAGYMYTECDYQLLSDNIMDPSHADYLHEETLGGAMTNPETIIDAGDEDIKVRWVAKDRNAPPVFMSVADENNKIDLIIDVIWRPPAVIALTTAAVKPGATPKEDGIAITLHSMVPETNGRTHYFYCSTRRYELDSQEYTEMLRAATDQAFREEDKPMLEKQQKVIGDADFWQLKPALFSIDTAAARTRRHLDKMIMEESAD